MLTPMLTRRHFLTASTAASMASLAGELFSAPTALSEAKKLKATYADIRIVRLRSQNIGLRLSPDRGTGKTLSVPNVGENSSFGFGVRVIVNGAWGFASSPLVTI